MVASNHTRSRNKSLFGSRLTFLEPLKQCDSHVRVSSRVGFGFCRVHAAEMFRLGLLVWFGGKRKQVGFGRGRRYSVTGSGDERVEDRRCS